MSLSSLVQINQSAMSEVASEQVFTVAEILEAIKSPLYRTRVEIIREFVEDGNVTEANNLKKRLPTFYSAGTFKVGETVKKTSMLNYSGIVCLDIDKITNLADVKQAFAQIDTVLAVFVSPSGRGIKVLVKTTNTNQQYHRIAYTQIIKSKQFESIAYTFNFKFDDTAANFTQACFMSHDNELYVNADAKTFEVVISDAAKVAAVKQFSKIGHGDYASAGAKVFSNWLAKHYQSGTEAAIKIIAKASWFGCSADDCEKLCNEVGMHVSDIERIESVYKSAASNFGTYFALKEAELQMDYARTYPLTDSQYAGNINFESVKHIKRLLIIAPTGSGKSHIPFEEWQYTDDMGIKQQAKQIWLFPTVALASEQFETKKQHANTLTAWKDSPSNIKTASAHQLLNNEIICGTYDSITEIVSELAKHDVIHQYMLIIDEFHQLITIADRNFRIDAAKKVSGYIKKFTGYAGVVALTATPIRNRHPILSSFQAVKITKPESVKKNYQLITIPHGLYEDVLINSISLEIDKADKQSVNVIYLANTSQKTLNKWITRLDANENKRSVVCINAKNRNEEDNAEFFTTKSASEQKVYIVTSYIAEGVNVTNQIKEVNLHVVSSDHPLRVEQMSKRFRKAGAVNVKRYSHNAELTKHSSIEIESICYSASMRDKNKTNVLAIVADEISLHNKLYPNAIYQGAKLAVYDPKSYPVDLDNPDMIDDLLFEKYQLDIASSMYLKSNIGYSEYLTQFGFEIKETEKMVLPITEKIKVKKQANTSATLEQVLGYIDEKRIHDKSEDNSDAIKQLAQLILKVSESTKMHPEQLVNNGVIDRVMSSKQVIKRSELNKLKYELIGELNIDSFNQFVESIKSTFAGMRFENLAEVVKLLDETFPEQLKLFNKLIDGKEEKTALLRFAGMSEKKSGCSRFVEFI